MANSKETILRVEENSSFGKKIFLSKSDNACKVDKKFVEKIQAQLARRWWIKRVEE